MLFENGLGDVQPQRAKRRSPVYANANRKSRLGRIAEVKFFEARRGLRCIVCISSDSADVELRTTGTGRQLHTHRCAHAPGGIPEAAAAGALGVRLGGRNFYFGKPVEKPTIGDPHRSLDRIAWRGAVRLMYGAELLLMAGWVLWRGCCG